MSTMKCATDERGESHVTLGDSENLIRMVAMRRDLGVDPAELVEGLCPGCARIVLRAADLYRDESPVDQARRIAANPSNYTGP